jgi:hypothetical protein
MQRRKAEEGTYTRQKTNIIALPHTYYNKSKSRHCSILVRRHTIARQVRTGDSIATAYESSQLGRQMLESTRLNDN